MPSPMPFYWCHKCYSTDIVRLREAALHYWEPDVGWVPVDSKQGDWRPPYCAKCHSYDVKFGSPHPSSHEVGRIKLAAQPTPTPIDDDCPF